MSPGRKPLDPALVERIRFLFAETSMNASQIARSVGVSVGTAQRYSVAEQRPHLKTKRGIL